MVTYLDHPTPISQDVRFQQLQQLPLEVEVLRLEELLRRPLAHDLWKPRRVHFNVLMLIERGTTFHHVDFTRYPAAPGHLFIIPALHSQAFTPVRALHGYLTLFTERFLHDRGVEFSQVADAGRSLLSAGPLAALGRDSYRRARRAFRTLSDYMRLPPSRYSERAIASAFSLLLFTLADLPEVSAAGSMNRSDDPLVARFMHVVEEQFKTEHQSAFYTDALQVSLRTLDRHIWKERSQTARQAISARLILEAKRLLIERDMLITDIADLLGFSKPQNFSRFFRTQTGISPEQFRDHDTA